MVRGTAVNAGSGRALICGSMAYDTIMVFEDRFADHILPDKLHILNVAFLVPDLRREFGGCAGNIAYNLNLLGGEPLIMATVGDDYRPYDERMKKLKLSQQHVRRIPLRGHHPCRGTLHRAVHVDRHHRDPGPAREGDECEHRDYGSFMPQRGFQESPAFECSIGHERDATTDTVAHRNARTYG